MSIAEDRPVARLALEDGTVFVGRGFGALGHAGAATTTGEVVFNTAMTGYQEAITDPSYAGQILVMTVTQIGNYGVCAADVESAHPQIAGFVARRLTCRTSNQRAEGDLDGWLAAEGIPAIEGIDTRALVLRLRSGGAMRGVLSNDSARSDAELVAVAKGATSMVGRNLAAEVAPKGPGAWRSEPIDDLDPWWPAIGEFGDPAFHVVALDCGAKRTIYRHLARRGCRITILPWTASAAEIRALEPDGLFISNGPGDPAAVDRTIETLREIAGEVPTFGICLGLQLLALALGATTYKLKFGHRGANQPVRDLRSGRVEITSQNHGFCVDQRSLEACGGEVTHLHLNDGTLAGFRHREKPIFAVQYHPEASPGPHDAGPLFDEFVAAMRSRRESVAPRS